MQRLARRLAAAAGGRAPVPLIECLRRLDHREAVVLEEELHARVRGVVSLVEGRWVVLLNARDARARARFTLAHEIGHVRWGSRARGARAVRGWARGAERRCAMPLPQSC